MLGRVRHASDADFSIWLIVRRVRVEIKSWSPASRLRPVTELPPEINFREPTLDLVQITNRDAAIAVAPGQLSAVRAELND